MVLIISDRSDFVNSEGFPSCSVVLRNDLHLYAENYFRFIAEETDIVGSSKKDFFEIKRTDDDKTQVNVFHINKQGVRENLPLYTRTFDNATKEIRLYGISGEDVFKIDDAANIHLIRLI
ncbi:MAG: hypothetical protein EOO43_15100, partial [Flavobacterium sp.]